MPSLADLFGPEPPSPPEQQIHVLVVTDAEEAMDAFEVLHPLSCKVTHTTLFGDDTPAFYDYECLVGTVVSHVGVEMFFRRAQDPNVSWGRTEVLEPGIYRIRGWTQVYRGLEGNEYDDGLELVGPDEE